MYTYDLTPININLKCNALCQKYIYLLIGYFIKINKYIFSMASQTFRLAVFLFMTLELIFGILYKYIYLNQSSTFLILENVTC